jgi:hypothetical protein
MEKAPGIELERLWPDMNPRQKSNLAMALARIQKSWTSISFKKFGSVYYATDLNESAENGVLYVDEEGIDVTNGRFAVGPSTAREYLDSGRVTLDFDRGPCKTSIFTLWLSYTNEGKGVP